MTRIALATTLAVATLMATGATSTFASVDGIKASKEAQTFEKRRKPRVPAAAAATARVILLSIRSAAGNSVVSARGIQGGRQPVLPPFFQSG